VADAATAVRMVPADAVEEEEEEEEDVVEEEGFLSRLMRLIWS